MLVGLKASAFATTFSSLNFRQEELAKIRIDTDKNNNFITYS
jgi:hypothetical protein